MLVLNGCEIETRDGFLNATQMCAAGGKDFGQWFAASKIPVDMAVIEGTDCDALEDQRDEDEDSWIHPVLAVQLAEWIRPGFAMEVARWIYDERGTPAKAPAASDGVVDQSATHDVSDWSDPVVEVEFFTKYDEDITDKKRPSITTTGWISGGTNITTCHGITTGGTSTVFMGGNTLTVSGATITNGTTGCWISR